MARIESLANSKSKGKRWRQHSCLQGGQRDEGGEEARIMMRALHGQDPSSVGRQVETLRSQFLHASRRH
jgi:hypothetical protein